MQNGSAALVVGSWKSEGAHMQVPPVAGRC